MIHQIIPIVREDHERVVVLISNGSSHTLSALQKNITSKKNKELAESHRLFDSRFYPHRTDIEDIRTSD